MEEESNESPFKKNTQLTSKERKSGVKNTQHYQAVNYQKKKHFG